MVANPKTRPIVRVPLERMAGDIRPTGKYRIIGVPLERMAGDIRPTGKYLIMSGK